MTMLDPRLHAFRPDLADLRLRGQIEANHFADGDLREIIDPIASLRREPRFDAIQTTQALLGRGGQGLREARGLGLGAARARRLCRLSRRGFAGTSNGIAHPSCPRPVEPSYPGPDHKSQPAALLPMNAQLKVVGIGEKFAELANGRFAIRRAPGPA